MDREGAQPIKTCRRPLTWVGGKVHGAFLFGSRPSCHVAPMSEGNKRRHLTMGGMAQWRHVSPHFSHGRKTRAERWVNSCSDVCTSCMFEAVSFQRQIRRNSTTLMQFYLWRKETEYNILYVFEQVKLGSCCYRFVYSKSIELRCQLSFCAFTEDTR